MSRFLNPDNAFFTGLNKIIDLIWISIIWSILCLPLFWFTLLFGITDVSMFSKISLILFLELVIKSPLMGPATSALYYTIVKVIRRERGYATKQFFHSFRVNFKLGALISVTFAAFTYLMYVDFQYAAYYESTGSGFGTAMYGALYCICIFVFSILLWIFPILSRFKVGYRQIFKNAFYIAMKHFVRTLIMIAFIVGYVLLFVFCLPAQLYILIPLALPGASMLVRTFIIEPVFKKYTPEAEGTEEETGEDRWYAE